MPKSLTLQHLATISKFVGIVCEKHKRKDFFCIPLCTDLTRDSISIPVSLYRFNKESSVCLCTVSSGPDGLFIHLAVCSHLHTLQCRVAVAVPIDDQPLNFTAT